MISRLCHGPTPLPPTKTAADLIVSICCGPRHARAWRGHTAHAADQNEVQPAGPVWLQKAERKVDKTARPVTRAIGKGGAAVGSATQRGTHAVKRGSDKAGAKLHEKLPQGHKPPNVRSNLD